MVEALLFVLGFSSVTAVYEVAKSGKGRRAERELLRMLKSEAGRKK